MSPGARLRADLPSICGRAARTALQAYLTALLASPPALWGARSAAPAPLLWALGVGGVSLLQNALETLGVVRPLWKGAAARQDAQDTDHDKEAR